jgi:stearoyl-CoA desaturase (delta-9 desaturase)
MSPNFAVRWFEIDPTYQVMRVLNAVKMIDMNGSQVGRYTPAKAKTKGAASAASSESPTVEAVGGE